MKNGNKKETAKMIKMKIHTFTFIHTQTMQIVEIKAYSVEGAIQQMGAEWQLVR